MQSKANTNSVNAYFAIGNANANDGNSNDNDNANKTNANDNLSANANGANVNPKCLGDSVILWDSLSSCWDSLDRASQLGTLLGELERIRQLGYLPRAVQSCPAPTGQGLVC